MLFGDRLMVGHQVLALVILVRFQVPEYILHDLLDFST